MNPLLSREIRERFRDGRAFVSIFVFVAVLSLLFTGLFAANAARNVHSNLGVSAASQLTGHAIFSQLAWSQTLGWLLVAPALTSSAIAYERERGWFDSLLLSGLSPLQIAFGKWSAALFYAGLLGLVTLPFLSLTFLLGGVSLRQFALILVLHAACALCGSAIGLAASAWSPRPASALRTAHGLIFLGFGASLFGAAAAGELPFRFLKVPGQNLFFTFLGRTNPVLRAVEISENLAFQRLGICLLFLGALALFFFGIAIHYAGKPLPEAPLIERRRKLSTKNQANDAIANDAIANGAIANGAIANDAIANDAIANDAIANDAIANDAIANDAIANGAAISPDAISDAQPLTGRKSHAEIPLVSRLRFSNPVLDREVRSKFRLRQPPLGVIVSEVLLGILVLFFYGHTLYRALFDPSQRSLIWWGVCFTAFIVSMMSAAIMGSNAFSREREGGTWEGLRLSLLSPGEILRGKVFASLLICALFSCPVWPLLLPCIAWNGQAVNRSGAAISPLGALACLLIWAATMWSFTLIGMAIAGRAARTGRASGRTLGFLSAFLLLWPFLLGAMQNQALANSVLALSHPIVALMSVGESTTPRSLINPLRVAAPYCGFQLIFGIGLWFWLRATLARELALSRPKRDSTKNQAQP